MASIRGGLSAGQGVGRTASPEKVRDAYRSMALRYHPDLNKGCEDASRKFQLIKDAFEEIQERQEAEKLHRSFAGTYRQPTSSSRYRYSDKTSTTGAGPSFHGFRRDRSAYPNFRSGYRDENAGHGPPRNTSHETLRAMRKRIRHMEGAGLGLGILLAGTTVCAGMIFMDYAWKARNRGKSFDELMKSLDAKSSEENLTQRKQSRSKPRIT